MNVLQTVKTTALALKEGAIKNAPSILTGMCVGSIGASVFLTAKGTIQATEILVLEARKRMNEDFEKKDKTSLDDDTYILTIPAPNIDTLDKVKLCWKCYVPAALATGSAIACAIGSNTINVRRNAALASAYALASESLKTYKEQTQKLVGENKMKAIHEGVSHDAVTKNAPDGSKVIVTGKGDILCFDSWSGQYFYSSVEAINAAVNQANEELLSTSRISYNDYCYYLGIKSSQMGATVGWKIEDGLVNISFDSDLSDKNDPILVIRHNNEPRYRFD